MTSPKDNTPVLRVAARILLIDSRNKVLMFRNSVPNQEHDSLWITPGGALDPGETYEQAALRELWEETGLKDVELGPCIWTRRYVWKWDETWIDSVERFYLLRTPEFAVSLASLEPIEQQYIHEYHWWSLQEIVDAKDSEVFVPRRLDELLPPIIAGDIPSTPIETGP